MNALWSYFWPVFAAGVVIGAIAGSIAFHRKGRWRNLPLIAGCALAILVAILWHGPLGGAARFTGEVERSARSALDYYEMTQVTAQLHREPLTRTLMLAGPADDFQRGELVRLMGQLPGVGRARWSSAESGLPLVGEAAGGGVLGFLLGLLLAYLVELHRRYNAQWKW